MLPQNRSRRAVVLFLRGPVAAEVDEARRKWDPVMARRIDPHLTLVHDVADHDAAADRVRALAADRAPVEVVMTQTACWADTPAYGVYLDLDDPTGGIADLHAALADLEAPAWARVLFRPHVTLVHGRTVDPDLAAPAWAALCGRQFNRPVMLGALDVIELDIDTGWTSVQHCPLRRRDET